MNFNQAIVAGNITKDPELRTLPSGQKVCSFTVATHRVFTDAQGQKQEETEFHDVVTWAKQAEIAGQYLKKGALVLVRGRLHTRNWADTKYPDVKHYRVEIVAETFELGPKQTGKATPPEMPDSGLNAGLTDQLPL